MVTSAHKICVNIVIYDYTLIDENNFEFISSTNIITLLWNILIIQTSYIG